MIGSSDTELNTFLRSFTGCARSESGFILVVSPCIPDDHSHFSSTLLPQAQKRPSFYLFLCVLAKWALFCIINLCNSSGVSTSLYFLLFHRALCFKLHPIAMGMSQSLGYTALSALPGTDATHRALQHPFRDGEGAWGTGIQERACRVRTQQ